MSSWPLAHVSPAIAPTTTRSATITRPLSATLSFFPKCSLLALRRRSRLLPVHARSSVRERVSPEEPVADLVPGSAAGEHDGEQHESPSHSSPSGGGNEPCASIASPNSRILR